MFGVFRRNKNERNYRVLEASLTQLLGAQKLLIPDFALEVNGAVNKTAIGYIYGFIDCAAQLAELEINCADGQKMIDNILHYMNDRRSDHIMNLIAELWDDDEFVKGMNIGGTEYNEWVKGNGVSVAAGLGRAFYAQAEKTSR